MAPTTHDTHSHTDVIVIDEGAPTTAKANNNSEREKVVDIWDESWVWDSMMDERQTTSLTAGFGVYSIAEAREWQSQLNRKVKYDNSLCCRLYCDRCCRSGRTAILIGNSQYEHSLWNSTDWYSSDFVAGFAAMVQHEAHMTTPNYQTSNRVMIMFTPYSNKPVTEILPYGDRTHFVSVVWYEQLYAVLYYNIEKRCHP